jgi:hypothetical protein
MRWFIDHLRRPDNCAPPIVGDLPSHFIFKCVLPSLAWPLNCGCWNGTLFGCRSPENKFQILGESYSALSTTLEVKALW